MQDKLNKPVRIAVDNLVLVPFSIGPIHSDNFFRELLIKMLKGEPHETQIEESFLDFFLASVDNGLSSPFLCLFF